MHSAERVRRARRFPLEIRAARTPDAPALVAGSVLLTFRDLDRQTAALARALAAGGVARGERVALRIPPGPEYVLLLLSLLRAGGVAVPVSTRLPEDAIRPLLKRIGCLRAISPSDAAAFLAGATSGAVHAAVPFDPSAPATVFFTSGSTGVPKAVLHSFENHWASAVGANRNLPLRPGDRWLLSLPLWHVGGLAVIFRCLQAGAAVAIAGADSPIAEAIPALGVTHVSLVATQLRRLLGSPRGREALRPLKAVLLGGGPLPVPLLEEAAAIGVRLVASYGSTEMSSQATATRPGDPSEALHTAGRPLPFREIAVDASDEILVRGRTLFLGYLESGLVRAARDERGWFHTGDLGRIDGDGRLIIAGRRDTMFISGGENIHPEEIERALADFPGVIEALVVPAPDPEFGARPAAFLRTASGELPDAAAIGAFLRRSLPGFKVPVRYLPWPRLEEGMKPDRRAFAQLARAPEATGRK